MSPWLYGTYYEDGERATKAMGKHFALLMKGHGANVIGNTIQEACLNTVQLERTAKMHLWAQSIGRASAIPKSVLKKYEQVEAERVTARGPRPPRSPEWTFYERLIKRGERWSKW